MTVMQPVQPGEDLTSSEAVLASHFTLTEQAGAIDPIAIEGLDGWTSPNPHPILSLLRWTTQNQETAAATLEQVLARFADAGRGFDWMTGPDCEKAGLLPLLESKGFVKPPLQIAAMAKQLGPEEPYDQPDGVQISKVTDLNDSRIWGVMATGFDIPTDVAAVFHHAYMQPSSQQRTDVYAAMLDARPDPVGVGYLSYIGDGRSVLLRVSCTLEGNRRRGIYSALVEKRLQDAARQGCTQAMVHSYSKESKRCLEKLGFVNVGTLQLHRWRP